MKHTLYSWHGTNNQGHAVSGEIAALTLNLAKLNLTRKGIQLNTIQKKRRWTWRCNEKISPLDIVLFFRQLSTLILAGIPIAQSIHVLSQQVEHVKLNKIITTLKEDIA